jgi:hypothetical protein
VNLNRRFFAAAVLVLAALPGLGAETVIDQLYGLRNYDLADAYWAAGQKFIDLGQADRGAEFQAKARHLYPGYVPGQAPKVQAVPAAAPVATATPALPSAEAVKEKNLQGEKIAKLQFQKLLRGYLTDNVATVASVLAAQVQVQGQTVAGDAATVKTYLDAHPADAGTPDDLFALDTLEVADGPADAVILTVKANPDAALGDLLPFWKPTQVYTFSRVGDAWKLSSIEGK